MASIHLQGILVDSVGEIDVGGVITFTHLTTTGETIASTQTELIIPPDGTYSIDVEYGQIRIDYTTRNTERFVANVIVNSASTATSLPELLSATTPVAKPIIIQMQGLVADATAAADTSEAFANQMTTFDLIGSAAVFASDTNITTKGYLTSGDGGSGSWIQNGVTGQTVSQSPAQLGEGLLNDGLGNQWSLSGNVNLIACGVVGDNSTDDTAAAQAALNYGIANRAIVHIPQLPMYFAGKLTLSGRLDITCDTRALMRWDSTNAADVGIEMLFSASSGQLCKIDLPCLYGPAINSSFSITGYGSGTQDQSSRLGTAVNLKGGNRVDITCQSINGFENAFLPESTSTSTCDNINFTVNTSDFCENFVRAESINGFGLAQVVVTANTVWAKRIFSSNTTTGYMNGCQINVTGTAFVNEIGGCGVYTEGAGLVSSTVNINQLQAGTRDDSRLDTPITLVPSGTMSSTPVEGEVITQAGSGASGTVVTNSDYTMTTAGYFTLQVVSGTFNLAGQLTGATSGALGAGSVPSSVIKLVCPLVGGNLPMNGVTTDGEQTGTIGYFGGKNCVINIGMPFEHPAGLTDGGFSVYPRTSETIKIRDNGQQNTIHITNDSSGGNSSVFAPVAISSTIGESNFDGGLGSAKYSDYVYCSISLSALGAGASQNGFLYHGKIGDNATLRACEVINKDDGMSNNQIEVVAFADGNTNSRQIRVNAYNRGGSAFTGTVFFYVKIA